MVHSFRSEKKAADLPEAVYLFTSARVQSVMPFIRQMTRWLLSDFNNKLFF
jgi:hypothetical protein